ncbi:hypothetical protein PRB79_gp67 [Klebsiella phage VLCpiS13d]|uniref:hypothetical protein n=1 Tax=Klebsiella phage VLCpiS13d TaxID=2874888 RepID=UPI00233F24A7|nr:hypothetical protein PRB79_gp67 [Klebsiella phage VLCpiS13d]UVX31721.1 hypothetical protein S13d_00058 [Klebsiella phage VLCpiS13d]
MFKISKENTFKINAQSGTFIGEKKLTLPLFFKVSEVRIFSEGFFASLMVSLDGDTFSYYNMYSLALPDPMTTSLDVMLYAEEQILLLPEFDGAESV